MNIDNYLLYDSLPSLDLHGYDRDSARVAINDFIKDSIIQKHEYITIVHGIGSGVIRKTTIDTLKNNKKVINFKTSYFNQGMTVVQLNIE
ncbi:MAG: Smr/MutS family protein [Bacilli bacterium]|nr:Smr/MutS family protein [Bacilli bacterium]